MKIKPLILTFLFLLVSLSAAFADDFQDGMDAYKRKDYTTAFEKFKPLAEQGNAKGQNRLGMMYEKGHGVPKDYKEAVRLFRLSAEQGDYGE